MGRLTIPEPPKIPIPLPESKSGALQCRAFCFLGEAVFQALAAKISLVTFLRELGRGIAVILYFFFEVS